MKIRVVDVESTGVDQSDAIVEFGFTDLDYDEDAKKWRIGAPQAFYVDPERPIPPEAMAIHHIRNEDCAGSPPWSDSQKILHSFTDEVPQFYCAHRVSFESMFIQLPPNARWICTWKAAVTMAPKAPGWSNQCLRYWLNLAVDPVLSMPPHRAAPDSYVTAHLLRRMLTKTDPHTLADITARPVILPRLGFGKHALDPCDQIPDGYWRWILNQPDFDEDVRATAAHYLNANR